MSDRSSAASAPTSKRSRARMETATPNKKSRRRRRLSTTPGLNPRGSDASSNIAHGNAASGDSETKIVWKDSPADKQIKVSGTDKFAVRKETQGFVGRLVRATAESSGSPPRAGDGGADTGDDNNESRSSPSRTQLFSRAFGKRKAIPPTASSNNSNRHLVFSPEASTAATNRRQRPSGTPPLHSPTFHSRLSTASTAAMRTSPSPFSPSSLSNKSDNTQDELLTLLDKIEEKYSTDDTNALCVSTAAVPVLVTPPQVVPTTATTAAGVPTSMPIARSLAYESLTPPPPQRLQIHHPVVHEPLLPECGSPLTEESWDLLDQLELQATQRLVTSSQETEPQVVAVPTAPHSLSTTNASPAASASSSVAISTVAYALPATPQLAVSSTTATATSIRPPRESFQRFAVLEVESDAPQRRLQLRLLDGNDRHVDAVLTDDWFETDVEPGDSISIVFTIVEEANGFFAQETGKTGSLDHTKSQKKTPKHDVDVLFVDNTQNVVIVHPDVLVSPTSVTTSIMCLRRAILCETLRVNGATHRNAFLGTLKHELFESALVRHDTNVDSLLHEAKRIVQSNILGLVECGLNEQTALQELASVTQDFRKWLVAATSRRGVALQAPKLAATDATVRLTRVLATEEMMWSIQWGLKGATDASVEAILGSQSVVLPLELKTGKQTNGHEHQGQVMLYTLLLHERYKQDCRHGVLLYAPGIDSIRIDALAMHIRSLLRQRNRVASALARVKALGSVVVGDELTLFPPMLRQRNVCERCFQINECVLHHAAIENGSSDSSGLGDVFLYKINHLDAVDLAYFRKWHRLLDLEQQHAEKNVRALWLETGVQREQGNSSCVARLRLVDDAPATADGRGTSRLLRFVRDPRTAGRTGSFMPHPTFLEVGFRTDDRVIVSVESLDGTRLLVHVARGSIRLIDATSLTVEVRQAIPSVVQSGASTVGKEFVWRLDKDAVTTALSRAKENLVRLFVGTPPEWIASGTHVDLRPELQALLVPIDKPTDASDDNPMTRSNVGDVRRRLQIIHLLRPRFKTCRVHDVVTQRLQSAKTEQTTRHAQRLLDAFAQLNADQQRAVSKVVSALDYALVLGMPGTGKTSTLAFSVELLLFLGFSVLVTSYTHSAVDTLLLKLLARDVPVLRLGGAAQVHPALQSSTLESQAASRGVDSVAAMESLLATAPLVGCTCLSVSTHTLFRRRRFDFCIVDEATQTTQPAVMAALRCADTFVLVGDQYQLPPLVASPQARKDGMDVSLFKRLAEAHPAAVQQLSFQYRMNSDIMRLANRLVYGEKLKCGAVSVAANHLVLDLGKTDDTWPLAALTGRPGVVFLDTDAVAETAESVDRAAPVGVNGSGRRRMANVVEARIVVGLVELLLRGGVAVDEVAVISPFRSQVALITRELALAAASASGSKSIETLLRRVEVSTIDKYQGKDKDVVLVSFVRSNAECRVGELLTDWRRINVALTRARQKLLLVGSLHTLRVGSALFAVLADEVRRQQWQMPLPSDALATLETCLYDVRQQSEQRASSRRSEEPEPEEQDGSSSSRTTYTEVAVLHPSDDNDDIEGLVPNISSLRRQQQHPHHVSSPSPRRFAASIHNVPAGSGAW